MHALKGRKYYACTEERSQKRREIMVTITRRDLCRLALLSLMVAFDGRSYSEWTQVRTSSLSLGLYKLFDSGRLKNKPTVSM